MKKVLLSAILLLSFNSYAQQGVMFIDTDFIAADKQKHFVGGGFIGLIGTGIAHGINGGKSNNSLLWGIASSLVIGTIKEIADTRKENPTGFSKADLAYTVAGGVFTSLSMKLLIDRKDRREKRLNKILELENQNK